MDKLVIATGNAGKLKEMKEMLGDLFDVIGLKEAGATATAEENGSTFAENALIKAEDIFKQTGENVLADDSGLCVEALDGAPGIFSARYAGENATQAQKNALLLKNLQGAENRKAKFVCSVALILKNGRVIQADGETEGEILQSENGNGGFGYDPLFFSYDLKKSFGDCTDDEKNSVSHRSRALQNLLEKLRALYGENVNGIGLTTKEI